MIRALMQNANKGTSSYKTVHTKMCMPTFTIQNLQIDKKLPHNGNQYRRTPITKTCRAQIPSMKSLYAIHRCSVLWAITTLLSEHSRMNTQCCQYYGPNKTKSLHKQNDTSNAKPALVQAKLVYKKYKYTPFLVMEKLPRSITESKSERNSF
jgi:hypothetical protein